MLRPSLFAMFFVFAAAPCFSQNVSPASQEKTKASFNETKEMENRIKTAFLESEEVVFKIKIYETQDWKEIKISDKIVLEEFSHRFRFNENFAVERFDNSSVPGLAISVMVSFSSEENFGFISSLANMHDVIVTTRDADSGDSVWFSAPLSLETVLVFNYYFQETLKSHENFPSFYKLEDYTTDYYSWSFVEDLKKKFVPYSEEKKKP